PAGWPSFHLTGPPPNGAVFPFTATAGFLRVNTRTPTATAPPSRTSPAARQKTSAYGNDRRGRPFARLALPPGRGAGSSTGSTSAGSRGGEGEAGVTRSGAARCGGGAGDALPPARNVCPQRKQRTCFPAWASGKE